MVYQACNSSNESTILMEEMFLCNWDIILKQLYPNFHISQEVNLYFIKDILYLNFRVFDQYLN